MKRYLKSKESLQNEWNRRYRILKLQQKPRKYPIPDNSEPWVKEIKSLKDLLYIADQVTRLVEIYGPDGILQQNPGMKLSEAAEGYAKICSNAVGSATKAAED